uniref:Caffeoyl-CoA O-methyltransferase n=1 Tax=Brassica campestris TaxID=3711 RepID=M4ECE5_BRACM
MANDEANASDFSKGLLQSKELYKYILETSVYPREQDALKELRILTHNHALAIMAAAPDVCQLIDMLLKLVNARKTIELGAIAINVNRSSYELGLPVIKKAGVEDKIDFRKSEPLPVLDELLNHKENEGGFDFAFVDDADKGSYWNYHERLMRLIKVCGIIVYDKTLWGGSVADSSNPEGKIQGKRIAHELNKKLSADKRVQISQVALGHGITMCKLK